MVEITTIFILMTFLVATAYSDSLSQGPKPDMLNAEGAIRVIRNYTFPCSSPSHANLRKLELDDDVLMEIFQADGGVYIQSYMARTTEEAQRNFRRFVGGLGPSPSKKKFRPVEDNWNSKDRAENHIKEFFNQLTKEFEVPLTNTQKNGFRQTGTIDQIRRKRTRRSMTDANATSRVGYISGARYEFDECYERGNLEADHLRLCETCAVTVYLPSEDYFPNIFNGAECSVTDSGCLYVNGFTPHGECRQSNVNLNVLERTRDTCQLAMMGGDMVLVDKWQLATRPLGTGCKCFIHQYSFLSDFV